MTIWMKNRMSVVAVVGLAGLYFGGVWGVGGCAAVENTGESLGAGGGAIGQSDVGAVLDGWHHAAAVGELEPYIEAMTEGAIFLGTDESERWTRDELQAYAEKYFGDGEGWVYVARDRYIRTNAYGDVAWVDEVLDNEKYGVLRGTAVLRRNGEEWRIALYSLSFLVPNDVAGDVVGVIEGGRP